MELFSFQSLIVVRPQAVVLERLFKVASYTTLFLLAMSSGVSEANATTTVELPTRSIVASSTNPSVYTWSINTSQIGTGLWFSENLLTEVPTIFPKQSGIQCYPLSGGFGGVGTTTFVQINTSVSHVGNTSFGANPCTQSGYYYKIWYQNNNPTVYYAKYYFNSVDNKIETTPIPPDLSATSSYQTRIQNVSVQSGGQMETYQWYNSNQWLNNDFATSFKINFDIQALDGDTLANSPYWSVQLINNGWTNDQIHANECLEVSAFTSGEYTFTYEDVPLGDYTGAVIYGSGNNICSSANSGQTLFVIGGETPVLWDVTESFLSGTTLTAEYLLETSEIVSTISAKNPTLVQFQLAKRPDGLMFGQGESIDNTVNGTGTVSTTFTALEDGTYDILVKFSNAGCAIGLSSCPFPLAYIYSSFTLELGEITNVGENEVYDNVTVAPTISQYEDCGLSNLSGCLNNSLRFLFIPSSESLNDLIATKDQLDTRIPFVYVSDIRTVAEEVFNSDQTETLDVTLDLGFGTVPLINESMIENAPQANTIRTLLSYMLWITFALGAYRMALGIHNKETT